MDGSDEARQLVAGWWAGSCAWDAKFGVRVWLIGTGTQKGRRRHDHLPDDIMANAATRIAMPTPRRRSCGSSSSTISGSLNPSDRDPVGDLAMLKPGRDSAPRSGDDGVAHGSGDPFQGSSLTRPRTGTTCLRAVSLWSIGRLGRRSSRQAHSFSRAGPGSSKADQPYRDRPSPGSRPNSG